MAQDSVEPDAGETGLLRNGAGNRDEKSNHETTEANESAQS